MIGPVISYYLVRARKILQALEVFQHAPHTRVEHALFKSVGVPRVLRRVEHIPERPCIIGYIARFVATHTIVGHGELVAAKTPRRQHKISVYLIERRDRRFEVFLFTRIHKQYRAELTVLVIRDTVRKRLFVGQCNSVAVIVGTCEVVIGVIFLGEFEQSLVARLAVQPQHYLDVHHVANPVMPRRTAQIMMFDRA